MIALALSLLLQTSAELRAADGLSPFALTFMLVSMGSVTGLAAWCFFRILGGKKHFDPDGTGPAESPVEGKVDREGGV